LNYLGFKGDSIIIEWVGLEQCRHSWNIWSFERKGGDGIECAGGFVLLELRVRIVGRICKNLKEIGEDW
jgi:hypothetical protein